MIISKIKNKKVQDFMPHNMVVDLPSLSLGRSEVLSDQCELYCSNVRCLNWSQIRLKRRVSAVLIGGLDRRKRVQEKSSQTWMGKRYQAFCPSRLKRYNENSVTRCWKKKLHKFSERCPKLSHSGFCLKSGAIQNIAKSHQLFGLLW